MIYYPEDENPNAATEEATTHESNAVVNNEGGTSETPSNLVGFNFKPGEVVTQEELDRILSYNKDSQLESKLTPNPAGFGFTRQEFVDSLPLAINARPNTLYCLKVKNDNILVGYKLYKFVLTPEGGEFRPFGATPDLDIEDGGQETPVQVVTEPQAAPEKVFNGLVCFNEEPKIKGKKLSKFVDEQGGVTQEELEEALEPYAKKTDLPDEVTANPSGSATSNLSKLQVGDTIYGIPNELPATTSASAGDVLALDSEKAPAWVTPSGGTKLYKHNLGGSDEITIISLSSNVYPDAGTFPTSMADKIQGTIQGTVLGRLIGIEINWTGQHAYSGVIFHFIKSDGTVFDVTRSGFTDTVTEL